MSMCRGRLGYGWCWGELSEDDERLPPSLASGSWSAGRGGGWGGEGRGGDIQRGQELEGCRRLHTTGLHARVHVFTHAFTERALSVRPEGFCMLGRLLTAKVSLVLLLSHTLTPP